MKVNEIELKGESPMVFPVELTKREENMARSLHGCKAPDACERIKNHFRYEIREDFERMMLNRVLVRTEWIDCAVGQNRVGRGIVWTECYHDFHSRCSDDMHLHVKLPSHWLGHFPAFEFLGYVGQMRLHWRQLQDVQTVRLFVYFLRRYMAPSVKKYTELLSSDFFLPSEEFIWANSWVRQEEFFPRPFSELEFEISVLTEETFRAYVEKARVWYEAYLACESAGRAPESDAGVIRAWVEARDCYFRMFSSLADNLGIPLDYVLSNAPAIRRIAEGCFGQGQPLSEATEIAIGNALYFKGPPNCEVAVLNKYFGWHTDDAPLLGA